MLVVLKSQNLWMFTCELTKCSLISNILLEVTSVY